MDNLIMIRSDCGAGRGPPLTSIDADDRTIALKRADGGLSKKS